MRSALVPLFLLLTSLVVEAQEITVRAVDGKTGNPLTNVRLVVSTFNDISERRGMNGQQFDLHTDQSGTAVIQSNQINKTHLQIWVDTKHQCVDNPNAVAISLSEILSSGVTEKNTCRVSIHAKPTPGSLTIYARDATLKEKMAW